MADIKIVGQEAPSEQPKEIGTPPSFEQEGVYLNQQVAELFNMSSDEARRENSKLETLIEYAKAKTDDHSPTGIYWALKQLGLRLGTPPLGEKMINHAYMYARLFLETQASKAKMEQLVKGDIDG